MVSATSETENSEVKLSSDFEGEADWTTNTISEEL